ncbi:MAG: FtsX-like permease family protein [Planctomycetaceae bacterium]|jgi:lipoprotein-releasing system permease protein|nr:FtsX-like permease family protein [Planctomycetaceae bacterium]
MYKLLICWRYLLTRHFALFSMITVMLGVATMIIVNAVMLGFATEMKNRIHGILSDVNFESIDLQGFPNADEYMKAINAAAGDMIEAMTPTIITPGMLTFRPGIDASTVSRQIQLIGIDELNHGKVSAILEYLQHPNNRTTLTFNLHEAGYDVKGAGKEANKTNRIEMKNAGWEYRRFRVATQVKMQKEYEEEQKRLQKERENSLKSNKLNNPNIDDDNIPATKSTSEFFTEPLDPFAQVKAIDDNETNLTIAEKSHIFDAAKEQHAGAIIGIGLTAFDRTEKINPDTNKKEIHERLLLIPGDDITLSFPTASLPIKLQSDNFTVVDLYESKMVEYDSQLVFVPIKKLQQLRGMYDPVSGQPMVSQILIKAKPNVDLDILRDKIRDRFHSSLFVVSTWKDKQESLIAAVFNELAMLNVLLFVIFVAAGFGIFSIFSMIVIEKTKDIGILKSLGASKYGVMQIFIFYSLFLGVGGSIFGLILGLTFVRYIKEIASALSYILQNEVFNPKIYYFYEIPTVVDPATVFWIICGAIFIAIISGIIPALQAARQQPVDALRN